MAKWSALVVALGSFVCLAILLIGTKDLGATLSPQGCRMSRMSPSYLLQNEFNSSWTPLARRYSLWLYREVQWDSSKIGGSLPVLFIPGNAGSSQQVRSIASSAARQYYSSPRFISPAFTGRSDTHKPLDFYAAEFNEDLTAFHGATLESQISYTSKAVEYILSRYPPNTRIVVMGHSMGGIVATSLLPSSRISSIITMSTPYTLPPARFDNTIDSIYARIRRLLNDDPTPIVSLCGGATDMMIPSESCMLPRSASGGGLRRTVFSSALEGAWTGVGHVEMVWCHQVRWRVARAALELAPLESMDERVGVLDRWLRDGHTLPPFIEEPQVLSQQDVGSTTVLQVGDKLLVNAPKGLHTYFLPIPPAVKFTLLLSQGAIDSVGPANPLPLHAAVYQCRGPNAHSTCTPVRPSTLKLIPAPVPLQPFPVPKAGSDESEGVVLFEVELDNLDPTMTHVAVKAEQGDGRGWIRAGFGEEKDDETISAVSTMSLLIGSAFVAIPNRHSLHNVIRLSNLLSHVLIVYRVEAVGDIVTQCKDSVFPPLLAHTSNPDETHYFPLTDHNDRRILLHTHMPGPFIAGQTSTKRGVVLDIYSSGLSECTHSPEGIRISIDWSATLGRWATRYWTSTIVWSVGAVCLVIFHSWHPNGQVPPVATSLNRYGNLLLWRLLPASFVFSFVPLPKAYYLGNAGEPLFAIIAPVILFISSGLVIGVWWILSGALWLVGNVHRLLSRPSHQADIGSVPRNSLISIGLLCLAIFLFIPWQVAYLGCWVLQFWNCVVAAPERPTELDAAAEGRLARTSLDGKMEERSTTRANNSNMNRHVLLLMTWLLPLVAPILAVWVRTLMTAGYTTPFNGDHNFVMVAPFLVFVDYASWTRSGIFARAGFESVLPARWLFAIAAAVAFLVGSIKPYLAFHAVAIALGVLICTKIGRRYWTGTAGGG